MELLEKPCDADRSTAFAHLLIPCPAMLSLPLPSAMLLAAAAYLFIVYLLLLLANHSQRLSRPRD